MKKIIVLNIIFGAINCLLDIITKNWSGAAGWFVSTIAWMNVYVLKVENEY